MSKLPSEAIDAAVDWWARHWQKPGSANAFRAALREKLEAFDGERVLIDCDYDPRDLLLEAVRVVEPDCRGFMFSAQGLLPQKTHMWVESHVVTLKHGYGAPNVVLWRKK